MGYLKLPSEVTNYEWNHVEFKKFTKLDQHYINIFKK